MRVIVLLLWLTAGCSLLGGGSKKHAATAEDSAADDGGGSEGKKGKKPKKRVVSEESGSRVAKGYNHGHKALDDGKAAAKEKNYDEAAFKYIEAHRGVVAIKALVKQLKADGEWATDVVYKTEFDDEPLDEDAMMAAIDKLDADASQALDKVRDKAHKAWKDSYGAKSEAQLDKLEELGKPARAKKDKKGTCWFFETDEGDESYCWNAKGKLAKHDAKKKKKEEPEESGGGDRGGGGEEAAQSHDSGPKYVSFEVSNACGETVHYFYGNGGNGTHTMLNSSSHTSMNEKVGTQISLEDDHQQKLAAVEIDAGTKEVVLECGSIKKR